MPVLITCKFDKDPIKGDWEKAGDIFSNAQGHVTPKWLVRYNQNSNLSEILCLSSLPVSLMKTEFTVPEKKWRHHFPRHSQWVRSKANNSIVKSLTRPKFELIQDFMPVLVTCINLTKLQLKVTEKTRRHRFSHHTSMGAFCCHGNHSFDPNCPKTLCSLSPTPRCYW